MQGVIDSKMGAPMVARALAIVDTCIFDAWAAYDKNAVGTQFADRLRKPPTQRSPRNKQEAISYAAYRAVTDLFPASTANVFDPLMVELGYDPHNTSMDTSTPAGVGNATCAAVLAFRHHDGSNQLGDLHPGPYSDWTGYQPVNTPDAITDPNRWQPLRVPDGMGGFLVQKFLGAQWFKLAPFAMSSDSQFLSFINSFGPAKYPSPGYVEQAEEIVSLSANLTDQQKVIAEYWAMGPGTVSPPGQWARIAEWVSRRDHHTLDSDARMFFALGNAMLDASIAAWDAKRADDSERPITAIHYLFSGKTIRAWVPFQGTQTIDGSQWIPYQILSQPTPPFPEYISGHSTYSAAGAEILRRYTRSDHYGFSDTVPSGSSLVEPGLTPHTDMTLSWATFTDAANQAGMSRRYGGIHFKAGDLVGRAIGRLVAAQVWDKAQTYIHGGREEHTKGPER